MTESAPRARSAAGAPRGGALPAGAVMARDDGGGKSNGNGHAAAEHVLLISVDGLHQSDLAWYVQHHPTSTLAHLAADLKRSPAERLRRAEELVRVARQVRPRRRRHQQVIGFDTYEDFYEWKRARRAGE